MTNSSKEVTLLIVEDDDIDFLTVERSFKKMKIANPLVRAFNGEEALKLMLDHKIPSPFIVLLDLQMPKMGGIELLGEIRANESISNTIVFVLTTSSDEKDILESFNHNVAGYFVKDEVGRDFLDIVSLLDGYWRIAHLPGEK